MRLLFSNGELRRNSGSVHLVRIPSGLYVVAAGYMCAVASVQEGSELIARLNEKKNEKKRRIVIKTARRLG